MRELLAGSSDFNDIDIVMPHGSDGVARRFAEAIGGSFFILDEGRRMTRVVKSDPAGFIQFDFADFIGRDLYEDLERRDFTMNAVAIGLRDLLEKGSLADIVDLFGGIEDIKKKLIRIVGPHVLDDDPLRLLRAVRFSASLGFSIDAGTEEHIRRRSHLVTTPAAERIKDELFRVLSLRSADRHLLLMDSLGLLLPLFPELLRLKGFAPGREAIQDVLTHSIKTVGYLDGVIDDLPELIPAYAGIIISHLDERLEQSVPRKAALKFGCLLHDIAKPDAFSMSDGRIRFVGHDQIGALKAREICQRLKLSSKTESLVYNVIKHHMRLFQLATHGGPSRHALFRYCRDLGKDLPESVLLALADSRSTYELMPKDKFLDTERCASILLDYYYGIFLMTEERPLITGDDLIALGHIPGPRFRYILDEVREKQAEGIITDRDKALDYIKNIK